MTALGAWSLPSCFCCLFGTLGCPLLATYMPRCPACMPPTPSSLQVERHWASFWHEAELMSRLNHPNVLRFFGLVVEGPMVVGIMTGERMTCTNAAVAPAPHSCSTVPAPRPRRTAAA